MRDLSEIQDFGSFVRAGKETQVFAREPRKERKKQRGAIIEEIYRTGEWWLLQQLRDGLPPGVIELSVVPGLNLKKTYRTSPNSFSHRSRPV